MYCRLITSPKWWTISGCFKDPYFRPTVESLWAVGLWSRPETNLLTFWVPGWCAPQAVRHHASGFGFRDSATGNQNEHTGTWCRWQWFAKAASTQLLWVKALWIVTDRVVGLFPIIVDRVGWMKAWVWGLGWLQCVTCMCWVHVTLSSASSLTFIMCICVFWVLYKELLTPCNVLRFIEVRKACNTKAKPNLL